MDSLHDKRLCRHLIKGCLYALIWHPPRGLPPINFSKSRSFSHCIYPKGEIRLVAPPRGGPIPSSSRGWKDEWVVESRSGNIDFPSGATAARFSTAQLPSNQNTAEGFVHQNKGKSVLCRKFMVFFILMRLSVNSRRAYHLTLCGHEIMLFFCYAFTPALSW